MAECLILEIIIKSEISGMTGMEFASPTDIHPIYKVYIR